MKKTFFSILKKEFLHIIKDPLSLIIAFLLPVIMLLLFGYAITLEMKKIPTIVNDHSNTIQSRSIIENLKASRFFQIKQELISPSKADKIFKKRQALCIINFQPDFPKKSQSIQVLIDASDPNAAQYCTYYLNSILSKININSGFSPGLLFEIKPRFLYNPDLRAANFFVPGLVAVILLLLSALLTSVAIVREKETGTLEQLLVSPVTSAQIVIGKLIPYLTISFLNSVIILFIGSMFFQVPFQGSIVLALVLMLIYVVTGLSLGLFISTITSSQQIAMMLTIVITILPTILFSGFIFPIESMPKILQFIASLLPPKYFIHIIRSIMLKGLGFTELINPILVLLGYSAVLILVCIKRFKMKIE
ncbi:ABC transporter permease [Candidatus Margulisiibacteriota bacterium]